MTGANKTDDWRSKVKLATNPFTVHECGEDEWVIRVHAENGSYFSLGALNGETEARLIAGTLSNAVKTNPRERKKWEEGYIRINRLG